jgi:nucleotide-binding universal stress UspA family protein
MITHILTATDGSDGAIRGVQYAAYLATHLGCKVTLIHVVESSHMYLSLDVTNEKLRHKLKEQLIESGRSIVRLSQKPLTDAGIAASYEITEGRPAYVICKYAEEGNFDLIIVGNHGLGKVSRVLLGSVSDEVVQAAKCPVLVVRS